MADPNQASTMSLKLLIDTHDKRVLFAEAGKDFADFLFHILSMPVGTVIGLLRKLENVGSLSNLYKSIENLNDSYMQPNNTKDALLKPQHSAGSCSLLLPAADVKDDAAARTRKYLYRCPNCSQYVSNSPDASCSGCGWKMTMKMTYVDPPPGDGGFVKGLVTYMVMDDLVVTPLSTISSITLLNRLNVKDVSLLEEKVVDFGMDEAVKLLNASLQSKKVLTDVFLKGAC